MNAPPPAGTAPADPPSPCIKVCKIDRGTGWCTGCLRTGAEIGAWPGMRPEQKLALLEVLKGRRLPR